MKRNLLGPLLKNNRTNLLLLAGILFITFLAYSPVLSNEFINLDDYHFILENPYVLHLDMAHIIGGFKTTFFNVYTPVTVLTFAVEHHFFGFNPFVYHLDNLLLHLAVTALAFFFLLRLGVPVWIATFSTLIFGVHPIHVESVAWVTERKDVLFAFFYMLALNYYLGYLITKKKIKYFASIVFGFLSILAKPMALSLPLILFLLDWLKGRSFKPSVFLEKIPYAVYTFGVSLVTYLAYAKGMSARQVRPPGDFLPSLARWVWSFSFYVKEFFLPINLVPRYFTPKPVSFAHTPYVVAVLVLILCVVILVKWRKNRWVVFSFAFYLGSIFFLFPYGNLIKNRVGVATRFVYVPSVGFCLLAGLACYAIGCYFRRKSRKLFISYGVILGLIICALAGYTFRLSQVWRNSLTFWTYDLAKNPQDTMRALNYRGKYYLENKKFELAMADADQAIALDPAFSGGYELRGYILDMMGQPQKALDDFNKAIQINKEFILPKAAIFTARASTYIQVGDYALAIKDCDQAIKRDPNYARAYSTRGKAFMALGDLDAALDDLNRAIFFLASDPFNYYDRGYVFFLKKDYVRAVADLDKAIALDPRDYISLDQRGSIYFLQGGYPKALEDYSRAIQLRPDFARTYNNRGSVYLATQEYDRARYDFTKAISIAPDFARAYYNRALVWQAKDEYAKALDDATKAQSLGYAIDSGFLRQLEAGLTSD